jgi:hypothetical protein
VFCPTIFTSSRSFGRALAARQRVEVADREVRIIGSKSNLLQTLTAASGASSRRRTAGPASRPSARTLPAWC